MRLDVERMEAAAASIDPIFLNTPQYICPDLSRALDCWVILKVETMNPIRCFKGRGIDLALSRIATRTDIGSVVCASAGNLGQALAYVGCSRNLSVTVTASSQASLVKIERMRTLGARVVLVDGAIEEALNLAISIADETGAYLIEDSKNIATCEGAGTIGLELATLHPRLDAVLIALGAGAMATGIGYAMKCRCPRTEVLTVQPERASAMTVSFRAGQVIDTGPPDTIADGVAGRYVISEVLADLREVTSDTITVSEDSIRAAMSALYRYSGVVVEPAAALGVAAILEDRERFRGRTIGTVLCGGNVSIQDFQRWIA